MAAEEAAWFLALEVGTVRNLTYRHEIPSVKIGTRGVRYRLIETLAPGASNEAAWLSDERMLHRVFGGSTDAIWHGKAAEIAGYSKA